MEKRFLRILYTINAGPYILARSLNVVQMSIIPPSAEGTDPRYGSVSLKRCLNTVCQSSPEIFQDLSNGGNRDFSVYHLDPLEAETSPQQVSITDNGETVQSSAPASRGVVVGMGLMSWGLQTEEGEEATLTGTLVKLPNGSAGLEVILALRETVRVSRESFPSSLASTTESGPSNASLDPTTAATIANIKNRQTLQCAPSKPKRSRTKPKPASEREFTSEADRLYHTSNVYIGPPRKKDKVMAPPPPASQPVTSTSTADPLSRGPSMTRSTSLPTSSQHKVEWEKSNFPLSQTLAAPVEISAAPVPSIFSKPPPHSPMPMKRRPVLPNGPFTYRPLRKAATAPATSCPPHPPSTTTRIDAPNIDPDLLPQLIAILRGSPSSEDESRNEALLSALSSIGQASAGEDNPGLVRALQIILASAHTPSTPPMEVGTMSLDKENVNPTQLLKPSGIEKSLSTPSSSPTRPGLGPNRNSSDTRTSHGNTAGSLSSRKRTFSDFAGNWDGVSSQRSRHPFTSPARPRTSSAELNGSRGRPILIPDSPQSCRVTASSPVRGPSYDNIRKKYVVPAWARTTTALKPRLSEDAILAQQLKEELQNKERRERRRRKQTNSRSAATEYPQETSSDTVVEPSPTSTGTSTPTPSSPPRPTTISSVVAACGTHTAFDIFSTPKKTLKEPPCTPPHTPQRRGPPGTGSVCTPSSSSLFTPSACGTPLGVADSLFSPFARTAPASPTRSGFDEDVDTPDSVPIASDDEARPSAESCSTREEHSDADEDVTMAPPPPPPPREFWEGLPPSSPPPIPSSPLVHTADIDDLMLEHNLNIESNGQAQETHSVKVEDGCDMGDSEHDDSQGNAEPSSDVDVFQLYTKLDDLASSDKGQTGLGDTLLTELGDCDFTELFKAFGALPPEQTSNGIGEGVTRAGDGMLDFGMLTSVNTGQSDTTQLAAQMQNFLGGCLM